MSILTLRRTKAGDTAEAALTAQDVDVADERPFPGFVRVNLIPQSIIERDRVARIKRVLVVVYAAVLLLIAALWWMAQRDIQAAQQELDAAEQQRIALQAQVAQYAEVPAVFATASTAQEALTAAMSREVRWAFLLNQLSFATPSGVTLNTVTGSLSESGPVQTSPGNVLPLSESVGTMTFAGTGNSFAEVAAWLDSLTTLKDYTNPFLTNSTKSQEATGNQGAVSWESTADLSTNALSGRFGNPAPAPDAASGTASTPPQAPADGAAS